MPEKSAADYLAPWAPLVAALVMALVMWLVANRRIRSEEKRAKDNREAEDQRHQARLEAERKAHEERLAEEEDALTRRIQAEMRLKLQEDAVADLVRANAVRRTVERVMTQYTAAIIQDDKPQAHEQKAQLERLIPELTASSLDVREVVEPLNEFRLMVETLLNNEVLTTAGDTHAVRRELCEVFTEDIAARSKSFALAFIAWRELLWKEYGATLEGYAEALDKHNWQSPPPFDPVGLSNRCCQILGLPQAKIRDDGKVVTE
jgi:hypothetical protein